MPADRIQRRIDNKAPVKGSVQVNESLSSPAPPKIGSIPEPRDLVLDSVLEHSAQSPSVIINGSWSAPFSSTPTYYVVQWSTSATFPAATTSGQNAPTTSIAIPGLHPATVYYVRVAAVYYSAQSDWCDAANITTVADTTPPPPPTGLSASFTNQGTFVVNWTPATGPTFRDTEIAIYDSSAKATQLLLTTVTGGHYEWTAAQNRAATSGSPDPSLYVEVRSRSWGNIYSASISASATKARPATPIASVTWDAVSGTCTFKCGVVADAVRYRWTIDGIAYPVADTQFAYLVGQNRQDHAGTADPSLDWSITAVDPLDQTSVTPGTGNATLPRPAMPTGVIVDFTSADAAFSCNAQGQIVGFYLVIGAYNHDMPLSARFNYSFALNIAEHGGTPVPSLAFALYAVDGLGQQSDPASGTAINYPPVAPTSVSIIPGFSQIGITTSATEPKDLDHYHYVILQNGATLTNIDDGSSTKYEAPAGRYSYTVAVNMVDVFNQSGPAITSSAVTMDPLTLTFLQAEATYKDSVGNSNTILSALKGSALIGYLGSYTNNYTEMQRPLVDRYKWISFLSGAAEYFLATSTDGVTWEWFSGPFTTSVGDSAGITMTSYGTGAIGSSANMNAASNRINIQPLGGRLALPHITEARFVRLYHLAASNYALNTFYARRYVQTDDLDADFIRGFTIVGKQMQADSLFAISSHLGEVQVDKYITIAATSGGIWQGTSGTGTTPVTGLKIWNDSGVGRLATYNGGTIQVTFDTAGVLSAGAGAVRLDATGLKTYSGGAVQFAIDTAGNAIAGGGSARMNASGLVVLANNTTYIDPTTAINSIYSYQIRNAGDTATQGLIAGLSNSNGNTNVFRSPAISGKSSQIVIEATAPNEANRTANVIIRADDGYTTSRIVLGGTTTSGTNSTINIFGNTYFNDLLTANGIRMVDASKSVATDIVNPFTAGGLVGIPNVGVSGRVDIGNSGVGADVKLGVKGATATSAAYAIVAYTSAGAINFSIRNDGQGVLRSSAWSYTSDARQKSRILDLTSINTKNNPARGLAEIVALRPRRFDYKKGMQNQLGFVAQEVQEIIPEIVNEEPDGFLSMQTTALIPVLVNAVKELTRRIAILEQV